MFSTSNTIKQIALTCSYRRLVYTLRVIYKNGMLTKEVLECNDFKYISEFSAGSVTLEDYTVSVSDIGGELPYKAVGKDGKVVLLYCCRKDGSPGNLVTLPDNYPFILIKVRNYHYSPALKRVCAILDLPVCHSVIL